MKTAHIAWLVLAILIAGPLAAHIGSPDVFFQGDAGPYHLVVSIRTPQMIPGIAEIQIRSSTPGVKQVKIVPLYIVGEGSKYPPPPDVLLPSKDDPQFFSGKLWLMASGSWQVRVEAIGDAGSGTIAVPVPAAARSTMPMQKSLGALLAGLMMLLVAGIVSIIGAARREGQLEPGQQVGPAQKRAARFVMAGAFLIVAAVLVGGAFWWKTAAANLSNRMIYTAPDLFVSLVPGDQMLLRIGDSRWHTRRPDTVATPLMPDHGHLMHLFLIRTPQMDRFYHLHPVPDKGGVFFEDLPPVAAGHYQVFADIVRVSGFPDTLSAQIDIPETAGKPLSGDDSTASAAPISADLQNAKDTQASLSSSLPDGTRMVWERAPGPLPANQLLWFKFRLEDANGKPVASLEPYMGMAGHAEFVRSDLSVFAHVHPDGSVPMAAVELADATLAKNSAIPAPNPYATTEMNMPGMATRPIGPEVSFPYGFPKPGVYRIFVQVKYNGRVETGVFDAEVK
ncbi:MAG: hypothetical protein WCC03_15930 [Candidatus Acidiferrales bacterium]